MQKHNKRGFVGTIKHIFNIRFWSDADRIKSYWQYIVNTIKKFIVPQQNGVTESFEDAKIRMNVSDADLDIRKRALMQLSLLMCGISFLLFLYAIYQCIYGGIPGLLLTLSIMCVALVMAFRYHFWYFQIKEKKLGCSIREWFKLGVLGEKQ